MRDQAARFLRSLWPDGCLAGAPAPGASLLLWTLPDKSSHWLPLPDGEVQPPPVAAAWSEPGSGRDAYLGVAAMPGGLGPHERGKAHQALAIPGLWVDLDVAGPGHTKKGLPATREDALELLPAEYPPSLLVETGGGLHAWWLFKEPWWFEDAAERDEAATLIERWQAQIRYRAASRGLEVDATADLARVLRLPGTWNHKIRQTPRPVTLGEDSGARYQPTELEEWLDEIGVRVERKVVSITAAGQGAPDPAWDNIVVNPAASITPDEMEMLQQADSRFEATWAGLRPDMADSSQSAYDMALANIAVKAGWGRQRVVDLIVANRSQRRAKKNISLSTLRKTVGKAFADYKAQQDKRSAEEALPPPSDGELRRGFALERLHKILGIRIQRVLKVGREEPTYTVESERGPLLLNSVDEMITQQAFRHKVAARWNHFIPPLRSSKGRDPWSEACQCMMALIEEVEADQDSEPSQAVCLWLHEYLDAAEIHADLKSVQQSRRDPAAPHADDGRLWINNGTFRRWLFERQGELVSAPRLASLLRAAGAKSKVKKIGGTTYSFWGLPAETFPVERYLRSAACAD
jgi:hypothetical protein